MTTQAPSHAEPIEVHKVALESVSDASALTTFVAQSCLLVWDSPYLPQLQTSTSTDSGIAQG